MSIVTPLAPYVILQDLGIPVVRRDNIMSSGVNPPKHNIDIPKLFAQTFITTLAFLIIIIWFTLALNAATREQTQDDYYLFQFAVYFSVIAIFMIIFVILLIT
jgi:hypothetical protein